MAGHLSKQNEFHHPLCVHVHAFAEPHKQSKGKMRIFTLKLERKTEGGDKKLSV